MTLVISSYNLVCKTPPRNAFIIDLDVRKLSFLCSKKVLCRSMKLDCGNKLFVVKVSCSLHTNLSTLRHHNLFSPSRLIAISTFNRRCRGIQKAHSLRTTMPHRRKSSLNAKSLAGNQHGSLCALHSQHSGWNPGRGYGNN